MLHTINLASLYEAKLRQFDREEAEAWRIVNTAQPRIDITDQTHTNQILKGRTMANTTA